MKSHVHADRLSAKLRKIAFVLAFASNFSRDLKDGRNKDIQTRRNVKESAPEKLFSRSEHVRTSD